MYKILLVDDEVIVRKGIRETISWAEQGFQCVGDCENGLEALEAIRNLKPDVVLTDIYMPFMDGLELARHIREEYPQTKVVILTGFDDFDYAQQAVKLNVKDFILKPITAAELRKVLDQIREELDREYREREDVERLRRQWQESMPLLRERFLEQLALSRIPAAERKERMALFGLHLPGPYYTALAVDPDGFGQHVSDPDKELLKFAVFNIVQEMVSRVQAAPSQGEAPVFRNREEKVIALLSGDSADGLYEHAQELAEDIRAAVERYLKLTVTVGIGTIADNLNRLKGAYTSSISALDYRLLRGTNQVISIMDMEGRTATLPKLSTDWEKQLVAAIKTGMAGDAEQAIRQMIQELKASMSGIEPSYIYIQKTIVSLIMAINDLGLTDRDVFGEHINPITHVYSLNTLEEIEGWLVSACHQAIRTLTESRNDYTSTQIQEAIRYIEEHYHDPDISLKTVCKHVHMSVSYFSSLFKHHTGKTFIEYLTAVRVGKAKELLATTDLKTYEIANRTGYRDPHYFSVIFKKMTGDTPTDFRNKTMSGA